jgi:hypothetical protein
MLITGLGTAMGIDDGLWQLAAQIAHSSLLRTPHPALKQEAVISVKLNSRNFLIFPACTRVYTYIISMYITENLKESKEYNHGCYDSTLQ